MISGGREEDQDRVPDLGGTYQVYMIPFSFQVTFAIIIELLI